MGITDDIKELRLKLCKMLDDCQGCTKTPEPKTVQLDLCKTCSHWRTIQEQRIELENLQKVNRIKRGARIEQVNII